MDKYRIKWRDDEDETGFTVWQQAKNGAWVRLNGNAFAFKRRSEAFKAVVFQAYSVNDQTTFTVEVID